MGATNDPTSPPTIQTHNTEKGPIPPESRVSGPTVPKRKPVPIASAPGTETAAQQPAHQSQTLQYSKTARKQPFFSIPAWFASQKRSRKYLILGIIGGIVAVALIIGLAVGLTVGKKYGRLWLGLRVAAIESNKC